MSKWNHNICDGCWRKREPDKIPYRLRWEYRTATPCCFCGHINLDGISLREDPKLTKFCNNGQTHAD